MYRISIRRGVFILLIGSASFVFAKIFLKVFDKFNQFDDLKSEEENNELNNVRPLTEPNVIENPNKLINLSNFEYLINQPSCFDYERLSASNARKTKLITVVLVHSAPNYTEKRRVVRETWGQKDPRSRILFVLGATNSTSLQKKLIQENEQFHDLIQGNFLDAYHNMTYKHVMSLKWFNDNCPNVKFLFRADDDIFVNLPHVYSLLVDISNLNNVIVCQRRNRAAVLRTFTKWKVSKKDYNPDYYPPYCFGYAIFYTNDAASRLYQEAQRSPYFWIDDVHITGTLRNRLNIPILSFEKHYYLNQKHMNDLFEGKTHIERIKPIFLFVKPNQGEGRIRMLWNIVQKAEKGHTHPLRKMRQKFH